MFSGLAETGDRNKREGCGRIRPGRPRRLLALALAMVLLIGAGPIALFGCGQARRASSVTVSFDSLGGSEIPSQTLPRGSKLDHFEEPVRRGYVFAGWFFEEAPVHPCEPDHVFNEDTTLFAGWYELDASEDLVEYLPDCEEQVSFLVHSDLELTDGNLADHVHLEEVDGQLGKVLSVKKEGEHYRLYSSDGFVPGATYRLDLLSPKTMYFIKAGDQPVENQSITSYSFTIFRENSDHVVLKTEILPLPQEQVVRLSALDGVIGEEGKATGDQGKTVFRFILVEAMGQVQPGQIVNFFKEGGGPEDNHYYKVWSTGQGEDGPYLDVVEPNLEDVYSELDVYYKSRDISYEEKTAIDPGLEAALLDSYLNSEGYDRLCTTLQAAIEESPTLDNLLATYDDRSLEAQMLGVGDLKDLLKNVNLGLELRLTRDSLTNDYNGAYGKVSYKVKDAKIPLHKKVTLQISMDLVEEITFTLFGSIRWEKKDDLLINKGLDVTNHFKLNFDILIATDSGTINITDEIQKIINSLSDNKTEEVVEGLNDEGFFGDDLDYVEVLSKELGKESFDIYKVLSFQFIFSLKVGLGARCGLNLNVDATESRRVGLSNWNNERKIRLVNTRLYSKLSFTATLKGQVGIRAGFEIAANISLFGLNDIANVGLAVEVGVYEELTGFLRFNYEYQYRMADDRSTSNMSLAGGLKSETGIYLELSLTWKFPFCEDGSLGLYGAKFPIFTIGTLRFASEFAKEEDRVNFSTLQYNIPQGNPDLLKLKFVDLDTKQIASKGVQVEIMQAPSSGDYRYTLMVDQTGKGTRKDLGFVSLNPETGMITLQEKAGTPLPARLDFTVAVQYTKAAALFSKKTELITKMIHFTYTRYQVADADQQCKVRFLYPDGSLVSEADYYILQTPVPPSQSDYIGFFLNSKYEIVNWGKPWKEAIEPIRGDTDFHFDWEYQYFDITFRGAKVNPDTGKVENGQTIAVVKTLYGEKPIPPSKEELALPVSYGYEHYRWEPALNIATYNATYDSSYVQRSDVCSHRFYWWRSNDLIDVEYTLRNVAPKGPDMTRYNDQNRAFYGWDQKLGPVNASYAYHYAEFRDYVTATFKDAKGEVIKEERLLQGQIPHPPEVPRVIEGDESHYEYRFNTWKEYYKEGWAAVQAIWKDTVYNAEYHKVYLPVTTVFDGDGHLFANGEKTMAFEGIYAANLAIYPQRSLLAFTIPQLTYRDALNTYTVDYWRSTEKDRGAYVTIPGSGRQPCQYNLTFKPVFKATPTLYKVTFRGDGGTTCTLTGYYGEAITEDMITGLDKPPDSSGKYRYSISDYSVPLPYRFGSLTGPDGLPYREILLPVRYQVHGMDRTYTFDANGGRFDDGSKTKTLTGPYGSKASFREVPQHSGDEHYHYRFAGWSETADSTKGEDDTSFFITDNRTLYAVYEREPLDMTVTFDANGGQFSDGTTQKSLTAPYNTRISFEELPVKPESTFYTYAFAGWSEDRNAETPDVPIHFTVTGHTTLYAVYRAVPKIFDITFDAGEGAFGDGSKLKTVQCAYGSLLPAFNERPAKADDDDFTYSFTRWDPPYKGGSAMTGVTAHTAVYEAHEKTPDDGIWISNELGDKEAISLDKEPTIPGYRFEQDSITQDKTLYIEADGLIVSGTSHDVGLYIEPAVKEVTFNRLQLSGYYDRGTGLFYADSQELPLLVKVKGSCLLENLTPGAWTVRLYRPLTVQGVGAGAGLTLRSIDTVTIYANRPWSVHSMRLDVFALKDSASLSDVIPLFSDSRPGALKWIFTDSSVRFQSEGLGAVFESDMELENSTFNSSGYAAFVSGDLVLKGNTSVDIRSSSDLGLGVDGQLIFNEFRGTFHLKCADDGRALMTYGGIEFKEAGYDLHGAEIGLLQDELYELDYYTFVTGGLPLSEVTVTRD